MMHKLFAPLLLFTAVVLTAGYTMQEEDLKEKRFFFSVSNLINLFGGKGLDTKHTQVSRDIGQKTF